MSGLRVDHLIYAVDDLDEAAARFLDEYGLASVAGGRHPGWGTANRIVPLGPDYLELVAVVDEVEAAASDFGRAVLAAGAGLAGWAVATDDLAGVARRLGLDVAQGSRERPDGVTLAWRLAGVARALHSAALPFFIQWDGPAELHPGRAAAPHRVAPGGIAWIEVAAEEEALSAWLGESGLPLRIGDGPAALAAAGIDTAEGQIVLRRP